MERLTVKDFKSLTLVAIFAFAPLFSTVAQAAPASIDARVAAICKTYQYTSDQLACLKKVEGWRESDEAVKICSLYQYTSDKIDCLSKFGNLDFDPAFISTCEQYQYVSDKVSCLLTNSSPMPIPQTPNPIDVSADVKRNVSYDLNLAIQALHSGDLANTEQLINAALNALNHKP